MTQKEKYIWLIDTIYRAKAITLEDLSSKWRDYIGGNVDDKLHRATFNRWREAIALQFKLDIECNRSNNKYYISNPEVIEEDKLKKWMLDTFATGNIINDNFSMSDRIIVPQIPSGKDFLGPIINAMKANHKILITFRKFGDKFTSTFTIEPYCLKLFEQRWYVLGRNNRNEERIFGLDRILNVQELDEKFTLPVGFDASDYFRPFYGVMTEGDGNLESIIIRAYDNHKHYLYSLPIHESQTVIEDNDDYADFSLCVVPTFDFYLKLLSYGELIEVLQPETVRKGMIKYLEEIANLYQLSSKSLPNSTIRRPRAIQTSLNGNFAAVDFETANGSRSSICSIGVIVVNEGKITDRFYSLVEPTPNHYTDWTSEIHGLTNRDTDGKPKFPDVWAQVSELIKGLPLVAHNSIFDEACLRAAFAAYGMEYPAYDFYCTLKASMINLDLPNHRLHTVAKACGFNLTDRHDVLAGVEACAAIALKIM